MKDNNDKHQVVMSREMYESLLRFAEEGAKHIPALSPHYKLNRVKWHVRKYNTVLRHERQMEVANAEIEYQSQKRDVARVLKHYSGKEVWFFSPYIYRNSRPVFYKGVVRCRSPLDKIKIRLVAEDGSRTDVSLENVRLDLPEGYVYHTTGDWAQTAIFAGTEGTTLSGLGQKQ
jgi:hypothetical protein